MSTYLNKAILTALALAALGLPATGEAQSCGDPGVTCLGEVEVSGMPMPYEPYEPYDPYPNDPGPGGSNETGGSSSGTESAPNPNDNPTAASCTSNIDDRGYHAAYDFAKWRTDTFGTVIKAGSGELIEITYDDGKTEVWMWLPGTIPASTLPYDFYLAPVPGTNCG